jgi:cyclopropane fatty-acyl-phospholipid synthase-like methyltransferase
VIFEGRFPYSLHVRAVGTVSEAEAAQVDRIASGIDVSQGHQILSVGADVGNVMVDRALIALRGPLQRRT